MCTKGHERWDAAAPVGVALAHGLHVSDLHGEPIVFNQRDVVLHGGLVICRKRSHCLLDAGGVGARDRWR